MSRGFASSFRIVLLAGTLFACFGALGMRLIWLHVVNRDELLRTATKVRHQLIPEIARRGDILDVNEAILATSRSLIVLGVDPQSLRPQDEKKWPQLAATIGMPYPELVRIFATKFREPSVSPGAEKKGLVFNFGPSPGQPPGETPTREGPPSGEGIFPTDDGITEEDDGLDPAPDEKGRRAIRWAKLRDEVSEATYAEIRNLGIAGVYGQREYRRAYPNNQLAAHVIGYVDRAQRPLAGMEYHADFYLRGQNGWRVGERDGRNRELAQFNTREVPRADGFSVTLSLNARVQDIVEQELAFIAQKFQPLKATIIVSDPRSGFILAMANHPSFNLNEFNRVPREEQARMKNIAVADVYEPGSVFKIVAVAGALEEGLVTPQTEFDCALEKVTHRGRVIDLPREDHSMGKLTVAGIISHSSNKGAAQLGLGLGEERFHRYVRAFGFGQKLGFPVGGEVAGLLNPWKQWQPIDLTRIPMGHSVSTTVLQMHQAMGVIASGGILWRPQIIREIRDASGEQVFSRRDGIEIRRVISRRTAETMAAMLEGVVSKGGTALEAAIDGFHVAGKTGTTQKLIDGKYDTRHHIASFVGFFPAADPQVAISVIVDDADARAPGGIAYGRTVAAPSFKRIGEKLIHILAINPRRLAIRSDFAAVMDGGRQ